MDPLLSPESLASGAITRGSLRWNYARVQPRVHRPKRVEPTLLLRTREAWLWSNRRGIVAGRAAAALHGARWVDEQVPIELITEHTRPRPGVIVREERIVDDDVCRIGDFRVTTPERTAFDLGRYLPRRSAVAHLDALAAATGVDAEGVLAVAARYPRARRLRALRAAAPLMDAGAQSPRETWLRLLLIEEGFPRPRTQVRVSDGRRVAYLDLGWEEPKIGLDYEGGHHLALRPTYVDDIGRYEMIDKQGWIDIRVVAEHSRRFIVRRARDAFARRGISISAPRSRKA